MVSGEKIGPYTIVDKLGEGGMGQVYRASDTNLKRQVALKVLPDSVAGDVDRLARFQREAEVLAALNHPHIAAIYGLERAGGTTALVMELVEGEDLSQRIARGALALDEALPIAKQIAEALEAAHEQGIIHRDLKPANIKLRADGTVKVLDFGLAKAMDSGPGPKTQDPGLSPTITSPAMTQAGMILGTAAYMSPEQAKGRRVDRRSDVWAFGAVLFEMLSGRRPFSADDVSETLAAVLMKEPEWAALPASVPPTVVTVLRRCLQKNAKQRLGDMQDVRLALEGAFETVTPHTPASASTASRRPWMAALAVAAVALVALAVPAVRHLREAPLVAPPEMRVDIVTPATDQPQDFALSPDGRQIVFVALGEGTRRLWLRSLATTTAQPLAGTEAARRPFWAPDSRSIGFFATRELKRVDLDGGAPRTLAAASSDLGLTVGGSWSADGVIVFSQGVGRPMMRVSAGGGEATAATTLGPGQLFHGAPHFLPDGRRFLFTAIEGPTKFAIHLATLDGGAQTRLVDGQGGLYLRDVASGEGGWLLWQRTLGGGLVAQRLNLAQGVLAGEPVNLADNAAGADLKGWFASGMSASATASGLVAYRAGGVARMQLTWVDRSGAARGTVGDPDLYSSPRVSPDGRRVVVSRLVAGNDDIWLLDGIRMSRFTFDATSERYPLWSPDGSRIVFSSVRSGIGLFQKVASGASAEEVLVPANGVSNTATSWSADGRFLMYISNAGGTSNADIWVVPMDGDRTPWAFLQTRFRELYGVFSPDGRWVAYQSDESGRPEIYVRPFVPPSRSASIVGSATVDKSVVPSAAAAPTSGAGAQWQVSTAGGIMPTWRADGKEIYYLDPAGAMVAAPITATGATIEPGAPVVLFPTRIYGGGTDVQQNRQYDVTRDGRFLINTVVEETPPPITLLMNWRPEGK